MRKYIVILLALFSTVGHAEADISDEQIKKQLIQESIRSYPGRCPCPYNTMSNGRSCGRRSAYSKPGGYSPVCYSNDVTPDMIERYRSRSR